MQRLAIRLVILIAALLVVAQFALPPILANRVEDRLTAHGGTAHVSLSAIPSFRLLAGHGHSLKITANGLSVDLTQNEKDVFGQLDKFSRVTIRMTNSRAGPFTIGSFRVDKTGSHAYDLLVTGEATAGDVARYAGGQLGGAFGGALAGLAASALGNFDRPIPFHATMQIATTGPTPQATNVQGEVGGFPAGPLAQVVANALLGGL